MFGSGFLVWGQKIEIGTRRPDRVNAGELAAELRGDRRQHRIKHRVPGYAVRRRGALGTAHYKERLAKNRRVGACEERLGHRYPGGKGRL